MDWKTFISQIVSAVAWPFTIVTGFILFRKRIGELLRRINRFKYGTTELEFAKGMEELSKEISSTEQIPGEYKTKELAESSTEFLKISVINQGAAILAAYTLLETVARSIASRGKGENIQQILNTLRGKPLSGDQMKQFLKLRKLSKVAKTEHFKMDSMLVEEYINICLSLTDILKQYFVEHRGLPDKTKEPNSH